MSTNATHSNNSTNLLDHLNDEQRTAVMLPDESGLILAGAGSGKTRVLTTRIAWLIQSGRISPAGVLAVTFTNKAAKEMISRISAMLPVNLSSMWIGTFHGLCNRMLRVHAAEAGLPKTFQILDMADQLSALKRLLKTLNIDDERYPPRELQYFINRVKEQGLRPQQVDANDPLSRQWVGLYEAYETQCQREGVVDFAELLLRCYELLSQDALRSHYQARFKHILIDEFQDTNKLQYAWLKRLAGEQTAMFAVGDDDQSIYAFRGANVNHMLDFEREFKVSKLIKLEQNYRSHAYILDAANQLIANNARRLGKRLRTDAGVGEPVQVIEVVTDAQEAGWIATKISGLIRQGLARDEIAVLYRSNAQSRILEHMLVSAGIAYRVYGGLRFFERQEIKHALAYLRLIDNANDDTAFMRVVNFPARGIGLRSVEQLIETARLHNCSMTAAIPIFTGKASKSKLDAFMQQIEEMRANIQSLNLPEIVEYVIKASGLENYYANQREGQERLENLHELVNAATAFFNENGDQTGNKSQDAEVADAITPLANFLSHASLEAGDHQAQLGEAVQLMTVHAAKGLEFTAVFITGLEEGLFPHENSTNEPTRLEEERRLMYVAITRAKARLYLSFAQSRMLHGQTRYRTRSRFFDELPENVLKWSTPYAPRSPHAAGTRKRFYR